MTLFEVGKPFPGPVPIKEGAIMELWSDGLTVLIQMPDCKKTEIQAFRQSFQQYSYFETSLPVPIAIWVFDFPKPHGPVDVNFNAKLAKPEYIENYLDDKQGVKNLITFYLLDGKTLRGIKAVGLALGAVNLFHATIRKQLSLDYTQAEYDRYLEAICSYSTEEIFQMGRIFKK